MKDNNTVIAPVLEIVKNLSDTYNTVIGIYSARAAQPLGLVDCGIYALAISEYIKHKKIGIEEYLKNNSANWHPHTYLYVLYSFLDIAMTLKLNNIPVLAALADVAYEMARLKDMTPDIAFMKHYMDGALITDAIDTERMKEKHKTEWFRLCLLALASFKKAQRIAILEDLDMPIREALLSLQIQTIHFSMVEPETKQGYTLAGISTIAYNHSVHQRAYKQIAESACSYLGQVYRKKNAGQIITKPYEFDPKTQLGL